MKHHKRRSGFSYLKKTPTRKLRKAMENFLRLFSARSRTEAKQQLHDYLYAYESVWTHQRKGKQSTLRAGVDAREDMPPYILANDYVIGHFRNGHFKTRLTVARHD